MRVNLWRRDFILHSPEYVLGDEMEQVGKKMRLVASKLKNARAIMKICGNWGRTRRLFQTWTRRQGTGNNQLFALIAVARAEMLHFANANNWAFSYAPDFNCSLEPISIYLHSVFPTCLVFISFTFLPATTEIEFPLQSDKWLFSLMQCCGFSALDLQQCSPNKITITGVSAIFQLFLAWSCRILDVQCWMCNFSTTLPFVTPWSIFFELLRRQWWQKHHLSRFKEEKHE